MFVDILIELCITTVSAFLFEQVDDITIPDDVEKCLTDGHKRCLAEFGLFCA